MPVERDNTLKGDDRLTIDAIANINQLAKVLDRGVEVLHSSSR